MNQEELKEVLHYNPTTGVFTWKVDQGNIHTGDVAGGRYKAKDKICIRIFINNKAYLAHRLAWLYATGDYPAQIGHCNNDGTDNSLFNLRVTNNKLNVRNKSLDYRNNTGINGVIYRCWLNNYQCFITDIDGNVLKKICYTLFDAACWRISKENSFGYYSRY